MHKKIGNNVEKMAQESISIGEAGLIVAYPRSAADKVGPAVTRALQEAVAEAEGQHLILLTDKSRRFLMGSRPQVPASRETAQGRTLDV